MHLADDELVAFDKRVLDGLGFDKRGIDIVELCSGAQV